MSKKKNKVYNVNKLVNHLFNTLELIYKDFSKNISEIIEDNRTEYLVKYKMEFITLEALLLFLFKSESHHNANCKFRKNNKILDKCYNLN